MKLGRLGVDISFKRKGLGRLIVDYLKYEFALENKTGCRFLTVDAYRKSLTFYEKNGFEYLTYDDENDDTRLMSFDLIQISNAQEND